MPSVLSRSLRSAPPSAAAAARPGVPVVLILGIESSTGRVGCAIGGHEGVRASVQTTRDRRHAELLAPQIKTACANAGVALDELGAVAVDVGPGLYTGLRVGVTTAITMAHALRVPMVPVTSLDLLAYPMRHTGRIIVAVIDARRGEVFHALYGCLPGGGAAAERTGRGSARPPRIADDGRRGRQARRGRWSDEVQLVVRGSARG